MYLEKSIVLIMMTLVLGLGTYVTKYCEASQRGNQKDCPAQNSPQMVRLPILENTWQITYNCDLPKPKDVTMAIVIFEDMWVTTFGRSRVLHNALHELLIEWSSEIKTVSGYFLDGRPYHNREVVGLARDPNWIWVATQPGQKICHTAFVHELVHIAIWSAKGTDGDLDHEGDKYSGWTPAHTQFIEEVNKSLCDINF